MAKPSDPGRWANIDAARQKRAHLVRLSEDQQEKADRLRDGRTVAGLLKDLLDAAPDRAKRKVKP